MARGFLGGAAGNEEMLEVHFGGTGGSQEEALEWWVGTATGNKLLWAKELDVPVGLQVTASDEDSISLSWGSVTGADTYELQMADRGQGNWSTIYNSAATNHTEGSLPDGSQYDFRVRAVSSGTESDWSATVEGETDLKAPTLSSVTSVGYSQATLNYTDGGSSTEDEIRVYLSTTGPSSGFSQWLNGAPFAPNTTSDDITNLTSSEDYWVKLRNWNAEVGESGDSAVLSFTTDIAPPADVTGLAANPDCDSIFLTWDPAARADHYNVYRRVYGNFTWNLLDGNVPGESYDDIGAVTGTEYEYRVEAENTSGVGGSDTVTGAGLQLDEPPAVPSVTNVSTTANPNEVQVSFTEPAGATSYKIRRQRPGTLSYTDYDVTPTPAPTGSPAVDESFPDTNDSAWDLTDPPSAPTLNDKDWETITLNVPTDTDADSFRVDRLKEGGSWVVDYDTGLTPSGTWTDPETLDPVTDYTYRMRAQGQNDEGGYEYAVASVNSCGTSNFSAYSSGSANPVQLTGYSGTLLVTTDSLPPAPTSPTSLNVFDASDDTDCYVQLSWSGQSGEIDYFEIQRRGCGGGYGALDTDTASPYTDGPVTCGQCYQYRIRAVGPGGNGSWTESSEITPDTGGGF